MQHISNVKAWKSLLFIAILITGFTFLGALAVYLDLRVVQKVATVIMGFLIGIGISVTSIIIPLGKEGDQDEG